LTCTTLRGHGNVARIKISSETIDSFGYADCPGHPVWLEPHRRLGAVNPRYPLQLIANQPKTRLHSQLDVGDTSKRSKIQSREPAQDAPF
jgi:biotin/methionine sulfoxide reductase